jgi:hypothetical protein
VTGWARGARALAVAALAAGCAQSRPFADELGAKPWEGQKALLPPDSRGRTLVPFYAGPSTFSYFLDRASVNVGEDGVVRYMLIARSPSGATNVSYEGIRCGTYERRVYAFGRDDGTWSQASNTSWAPINRLASDPQTALADYVFCTERGPVSSTEEALEALDRGNRRR